MQQARDATSGVVVASRLRCADTHWTRLFGLLGTKELPSGEGQWRTAMPIVVLEAMLVFLALTRRPSVGTSARPADWTIGIVGAFVPLLLRPGDGPGPLARLAEPLQAVGLLITLAGVLSLGRSFGLIAADRGIKTNGV